MDDVIVIGGSYAGIAAALQLARARRRVLVLDAGQRRNRFASSSHGFLGQDGQSPEAIAAKGRSALLAYPTAAWRAAAVTETRAIEGGFVVRAQDEEHRARKLILATGVVDELPAVPGLAERWGKSVFHCPYCHGYELGKGRVGVLAVGELSMHQAVLASEWAAPGQTTLFLNGTFEPTAEHLAELEAHGVRIEAEPVARIGGDAPGVEVQLHYGHGVQLDGLFVLPHTRVAGPFAEQLGCELDTSPVGSFYKTDAMKDTTVPGVFACGDAGLPMGSVAFAVADGVRAGVSAHRSLVFGRQHAA